MSAMLGPQTLSLWPWVKRPNYQILDNYIRVPHAYQDVITMTQRHGSIPFTVE